jgi:hypothetical protein
MMGPSGYWKGAANLAVSVMYASHRSCQAVAFVREGAGLFVVHPGKPPAANK